MEFLIDIDEILGKDIVTSGANIIGKVTGAKIDQTTWDVKLLDVKLTGEAAESLKMKKRFGSSKICIPTHWVQAVGHVITINRSVAELETSQEIIECKE